MRELFIIDSIAGVIIVIYDNVKKNHTKEQEQPDIIITAPI